jgi:hypothetical protein
MLPSGGFAIINFALGDFMKNKIIKISLVTLSLFSIGCSSSKSSADKPSEIIAQFNAAMSSAGSQLETSSLAGALTGALSSIHQISSVDDVCDENGQPIDGGDFMSQSDPEFPARTFYCKLVKNTESPESVQGAYSLIKSVSCALENAGIVFDGVEHSATVNVDSTCFSEESLADGEMPGTIDVKYTASQPASFNPNFQTGVEMTIPDFGTFSLAASVDGSSIRFLGYENQGSTKTGAYVGQFDSETGEIRFESRHDRFNMVDEGSDGGWSKHDRIYVKCSSVSSDGECEGIEEVQAATSDIFNDNDYGKIMTMSGDFSVGVRTRFYEVNTVDQYNDPSMWSENTAGASRCYTLESPTAGDCDSNSGIRLPSAEFEFTLFDGFTPNSEWYQDVGELTFTSVSLADEIP